MLQLPPPFYGWSQLFEKWITVSTGQITTLRITQVVFQILIRWIVIYAMDSAIQRLNNAGLDEVTSLLFIRLFPGLSLLLRRNYWELKASRRRQDQQCQKKTILGYIHRAPDEFSATGGKFVRWGVPFIRNTLTVRKFSLIRQFIANRVKILNGFVWTKCPVKFFSRSKIRPVPRERCNKQNNNWRLAPQEGS